MCIRDRIVEHRQVTTAQFNVDTRVLTLPTWNHRVNAVTDLLIAHEVGHALYTPNEWDYLEEVPQQFVNVTEDIRIEKLMKRRYQGLPKTFYAGYETLSAEDFFQIEGVEWSNLNLADKLNLYFKIGNFVETKKTKIGKDSKANHFAYLGDAEIGAESNIGAGTITCNYDGFKKNKTN